MADPEHLEMIREGVETWNRWRKDHFGLVPMLSSANLKNANLSGAALDGAQLIDADLSNADLSGANLIRANLHGTQLEHSDVSGAALIEANLRGTHLQGANLCGAHLMEANLRWADLSHASLQGANLGGANLNGANLSEADLTGASLLETVLSDTNLSKTIGLASCKHVGPSTIDHRTFAKSGQLPIFFLRGCGVPETLIAYLPSLLEQPVQFYSCFISYSTRDQEFADRLHADLQDGGVRCWFAPHDMQGGKKTYEQIDEAIRLYDRLLLILSEHSINSEWVRVEIAKARKRESTEKRRMLFPLRLVDFEKLLNWDCFDADRGTDSAAEIRQYFIPDFSDWKNYKTYQKTLAALRRDLKTDGRSAGFESRRFGEPG